MDPSKNKIYIGIPVYGDQSPKWWQPAMQEMLAAPSYGLNIVDIDVAPTMATDFNRNRIVQNFLESDADWLYWWDADNVNPVGTIARLLEAAEDTRTLIGGAYITKNPDDPKLVAYVRTKHDPDKGTDGQYRSVGYQQYSVGEILPIDAMGMNSVLSHRSVYEDIEKNYVAFLREDGGIVAVHVDDIQGDIPDYESAETDNKVVNGVLHTRLRKPVEKIGVPFFTIAYNRTEDFGFFEKAKRCGHQAWLDTSIESGHLDLRNWKPKELRRVKQAQEAANIGRGQKIEANRRQS